MCSKLKGINTITTVAGPKSSLLDKDKSSESYWEE
jgi:hypothetical protein